MQTEFQSFFNDLRAAVRSGVNLEIGDSESPARSLSLKQLDQLEAGAANSDALPERFEAAIETWQKTGSMIPVLEGLSTRKRASQRIHRLFMKSLIYVFAIAILALSLIHI